MFSQHVMLPSFNKVITEKAVAYERIVYFANLFLSNHSIFFDSTIFTSSGYSSAAPSQTSVQVGYNQ